jgi:hypothetical protein
MRYLALFLILAPLIGACSPDEEAAPRHNPAQVETAEVAVENLRTIRDATVRYWAATGSAPVSIDLLSEHGAGVSDLRESDVYSEFGYNFTGLLFDEAGELARGWFFATPRRDREGLQVRLDGVTDEVEYLPKGQPWGRAAGDDSHLEPPEED